MYILYSHKTDRYYIGFSLNVQQRLHYHNLGRKGWTKRGIPWDLVFEHPCRDKVHAMQVERMIKKQKSRHFIEDLISGTIKL
ncbi:GIY-YIG nuclease family protein [bacterium]|nr:GIY-YIG nuclease family protein [bacterium]